MVRGRCGHWGWCERGVVTGDGEGGVVTGDGVRVWSRDGEGGVVIDICFL